jgi:hypothetical protein
MLIPDPTLPETASFIGNAVSSSKNAALLNAAS